MKDLSPETLLDLLGLDYAERTNRLSMLCPWHDDTDPSSGFYLDTQKFFCFSCEISYTLTQFYANFKGVTEQEAENELQKEFGSIPEPPPVDHMTLARCLSRGNAKLKEIKDNIPREYHAFLAEQLDRALLFYERRRIPKEKLDNVLEIWYNRVEEARNGTDPRRTPGIDFDVRLKEGMGHVSRIDPGAGAVDLD